MYKKLLSLFSIIQLAFLSTFAQSASSYTIIDTRTGNEVDFRKMTQKLNHSDIILFGEEHNDAIAHALQFQLVEDLYYMNKGNIALSFEMWERDVQSIMDEYLQGFISEKNFKKESRAWGNYDDYKPMIEFAKTKQIPVTCANSPARYTNMVTRGTLRALDKLPKATKAKYLSDFPIDTLAGRYYEKFLEAMGGHTVPNMYLYHSQNLWDATMTYSILETMAQDPFQKVIHFNGRFHSDENLGVTQRLKRYDAPQYKIATISCVQEDEYTSAYSDLADYVILTGKKKQ